MRRLASSIREKSSGELTSMISFEGYDRRIGAIEALLKEKNISSLEHAKKICDIMGLTQVRHGPLHLIV